MDIERALVFFGYLAEAWAVSRFFNRILGKEKRKERLFFPLFLIGRAALGLLPWHFPLPYIVLACLNHGFLIGLCGFLFSGKPGQGLFVSSVLTVVFTLFGSFFSSLLSMLALVFLHLGKGIREPFLSSRTDSMIACISLLGILGAMRLLGKHAGFLFGGKSPKWYRTAAGSLLMLGGVVDAANWGASNGVFLRGGGSLYYAQLLSHGEICVLAVFSLSAAGVLLLGMNRIYDEQEKSGRYYGQLTAYQMLTEQYRRSERLRHDLKNHVIALQGLLGERDWKGMEAYLTAMEERGSLGEREAATGSLAIDALLDRKRKQAEEKGISWECSVTLPKESADMEFDLCVLFGNLLDNAVKACEQMEGEGRRFLSVQARMVKRCFLLEVKNSTGTKTGPKKKQAEGMGREGSHGLGLLNVKDVVEKYQGTMEIEEQNGLYLSTILLPAGIQADGDAPAARENAFRI